MATNVAEKPAVRTPPKSQSAPKSDGTRERDMLSMMVLIRRFEEQTYREYTKPGQKIGGFCHLYNGQEAVAVGIASIFDKKRDYLINAYRCHGHSLALGMSPRAAMAELFGKETGCSKGKGGSMHLFSAEDGNLGGHGIVGGHLPVALGTAFAQKYREDGGVTYCLFGDGAINQGTFMESMNMASLLKAPVIYIIENNGIAMGTQIARHSAEKDLTNRGQGYAMPHKKVDGNDLDAVIEAMTEARDRGRNGEGPTFLNVVTFRFRGHSMSDPLKYRSKEEAEKAKETDPITLYSAKLRQQGLLTDEQMEQIEERAREDVKAATDQADQDNEPPLEDRFKDIFAEKYPLQK